MKKPHKKKIKRKRRVLWLRLILLMLLPVVVVAALNMVEANILRLYGREGTPAAAGISLPEPGVFCLLWAGKTIAIDLRPILEKLLTIGQMLLQIIGITLIFSLVML